MLFPSEQYVTQLYKHWDSLLTNYSAFFKEIYPDYETKQVEKGERLYPDDFIIIAVDLGMVIIN